jgi:protein tyrosine/serine phosphatase
MNVTAGLFVAAILIGIPAGYAHYRHTQSRNVRVVEPEILYRSGQLSKAGLERLIHDHGIRTVISLRDSDDPSVPPPDRHEEHFCEKQDIKFVRVTPKSWWPEYDGPPPAEKGVATFLKVMDDPANYPVLLHCFAGTHRTGAMVAIYRMEFNHWSNDEALAELRNGGYKNLDKELDVLTYLEKYQPRWKK